MKDKKRIQFDFTTEALDDLDDLKLRTKSTNRAEVIRRALRFFDYAVSKAEEGYSCEMVKGKKKETLAPLLVV